MSNFKTLAKLILVLSLVFFLLFQSQGEVSANLTGFKFVSTNPCIVVQTGNTVIQQAVTNMVNDYNNKSYVHPVRCLDYNPNYNTIYIQDYYAADGNGARTTDYAASGNTCPNAYDCNYSSLAVVAYVQINTYYYFDQNYANFMLLHEFGHAVGLAHANVCNDTVMNTCRWAYQTLQPYDINDLNTLYP